MTSTCVDCAILIIGERPRCPACHARHAVGVMTNAPMISADMPAVLREDTLGQRLLTWAVAAEILIVIACGFALATRTCGS